MACGSMSADNDHEERRKDLWEAEEDLGRNGPELGQEAGGEEVADRVLEVVRNSLVTCDGRATRVEDDASVYDSVHDRWDRLE